MRGDGGEHVAAVERRRRGLEPVLGRADLDRLGDAAEALRGRQQQAVVRPDQDAVLLGGAQRDGAPLGADPGVDDREVDARREVGQRTPQHERAGADVVARDAVRDVDDPRVGRGPRDHAVAHADEVVVVAVVAEERQHPSHARESMHWRGGIIRGCAPGMGASRAG